MQRTNRLAEAKGDSRRHPGECEVCEDVRMVRTERFRHGGPLKVVRVCRTCAASGREIERDERLTKGR